MAEWLSIEPSFIFCLLNIFYALYNRNVSVFEKNNNKLKNIYIIASGASYLVCSMPALSIYIYNYTRNRSLSNIGRASETALFAVLP